MLSLVTVQASLNFLLITFRRVAWYWWLIHSKIKSKYVANHRQILYSNYSHKRNPFIPANKRIEYKTATATERHNPTRSSSSTARWVIRLRIKPVLLGIALS